METERLRYFCVIAETGSLTAAAEILNISHSGLSKAMTALQQELSLQLLRPLGRGLELTEEGERVYRQSQELLQSLESLKNQKPKLLKKHIRIGLAEVFVLALAGKIVQAIKELEAQIDLYEFDSGEAEVRVLEGDLDFAVSFIPFPHPELEYLKIKKISMGVFFKNPEFKKLNLSQLPFVVPNSEIKNNPLSIKSRDGWPAELPRQSIFGASSLAMALQIVEAGEAVVFMPQFLGLDWLQEFEVKKSLFVDCDRDIFIVKKKNREESKAMKLVAKVIRQHC